MTSEKKSEKQTVRCPQEGKKQTFRPGQFLVSPTLGQAEKIHPLYLLSGHVTYLCKTEKGSLIEVNLGPGHMVGLECLYTRKYPVSVLAKDAVEIVDFELDTFELYLGKDIEFAVDVITSLSRHQRRIDEELAFRARYQRKRVQDSATMLYLLGQKNFHNGMLDLAQDYFERIQQNYPDSPYHRSASGYLVQIKRKGQKKKKSPLPEEETFKISEELPEESEQMDLYHFAFYGISEISNSLYQKFGRSYRPGEVIFHEGDPGKELFIILEGSVEVSREEQAFTCLTTGDIFGEVSLFDGKPRSNTVTAIEPLRVLALTDKPFSMIFQLHPSWTLQLIQGFATRIAHSYELLTRGVEPAEVKKD